MKTTHIACKICHLCAVVFMSLSVGVIMLHSVVPHHHHDQCDNEAWGMVCEEELLCHCDEGTPSHDESSHHHDGHQPFDLCTLQKLLSHLVLATQDDRIHLLSAHPVAIWHHATFQCCAALYLTPTAMPSATATGVRPTRRQPCAPIHGAMVRTHGLRAPPLS